MLTVGANTSVAERIRRVAAASTGDFMELVGIAGLDPTLHFRFADWSGVDFSGCNLRGFDFTGARLHGCRFDGAKIARGPDRNNKLASAAAFDLAELGAVCLDREPGSHEPAVMTPLADLSKAEDWQDYVRGWRKAGKPPPREHLEPGAIFSDAPFAPEMVVVPAGSFRMGTSPEEMAELERQPDKEHAKWVKWGGPPKPVTIAQPFAVGRVAVTFEEWDLAQGCPEWRKHSGLKPRRPDDQKWGRGRRPAIDVSWDDALAYCRWLEAVTGKPYRLPSEAEWEYCCRAGTTTPFWRGTSISIDQANYNGGPKGEYWGRTMPVDGFEANPWGLYQVHGNIWEWCQDEWHDSYGAAPDDGSAWESGAKGGRRVIRGGSWGYSPPVLRSANRYGFATGNRVDDIGFRVVRTLSAGAAAITVAPGEHYASGAVRDERGCGRLPSRRRRA